MGRFSGAVEYVLSRENGINENPLDPGGTTKFGISLRFLKALSVDELKKSGVYLDNICSDDIKQLTQEQAILLYKHEFWDHAAFAEINDQSLCNYVFDMSVNMGIAPAIKALQRAVWAYTKSRDILVEDGLLGDETLHVVNHCNAINLLSILRSERAGDYRVIVAHHPDQKEFITGWLNRAYEG